MFVNAAREVEWEQAPCNLCGQAGGDLVLEGPDRLLHLAGWFRVVRCPRCGLLRQDPRPTPQSIGFYYPTEYGPYSIAIDDEASSLARQDRRYGMWKRRVAIERYVPGGRLLDVGCATGNFLHEMARSGSWEVEGVEPSPEAAARARQRLGLAVHVGRLEEVELPASVFDVVTMWNVLEHLHDPLASLRIVRRVLKPGGLFVFSIPNMESIEAKLFGRYWLGWDLPRHIHFFPRPVASSMLREAGLSLLRWRCLAGAYLSFLLTLQFLLEGAAGRTWWSRALLALLHWMPMRLLAAPLFWVLTQANQAAIITGFARAEVP